MALTETSGSGRRWAVVMPTWIGDVVMATPLLRAVRSLMPQVHLSAVIHRNGLPLLEPCPWVDELVPRDGSIVASANRLREGSYDAAILLPNSFRSALVVRLAGIARRIGYARDGRGWMLTDKLAPPREGGALTPVPAVEYYLAIAKHLGAMDPDPTLELFTAEQDEAWAHGRLREAGWDGTQPLVVLNPGASKAEKRWPAERFAKVADRCVETMGAFVVVSGAPSEQAIVSAVIGGAKCRVSAASEIGIDLRRLKSVLRQADLMLTNDTGPRHIAAAVGCAVVTMFGPTGPAWTLIPFEQDIHVVASGGDMAEIEVEEVWDAMMPMLSVSRDASATRGQVS